MQFLKKVAQQINTRFSNQLHRIAIVFPNRRQSIFFKSYLQEILTPPAFLPELLTIEELVQRSSIHPMADHFVQSFVLYDAYAETMEQSRNEHPLDYEKFYAIGDILLRDFQELDAYLCNVPKVFEQLKDIEGIEKSFEILSDEQKQFLKTFWSSFSSERKSVQQQKFLELWKMLPSIYKLFHQKLSEQQLTTQGMAYRLMAAGRQTRPDFANGWQHVAFVGFNAFNKAEETLLQHWQQQGKASLWMDIDEHYVTNPQHEAGHFIRKNLYKLQLKNELPLLKEIAGKTTTLQVISAQGSVAQTKYLPQWLKSLPSFKEESISSRIDKSYRQESIAIILADEGLLLPVLQSLPAELSNVNVTMGYPLKQSVLFSFIQTFFFIQTDLAFHHDRDISYEQVQAFLQHPLCDWGDGVKQNLQYRMVNEVLLRIPLNQLQGHSDIGNYVFSPLHKPMDIFSRLQRMMEAFQRSKRFETDSLLQGLLVQVWQSVQQLNGLFMGSGLTPGPSPGGEEPTPWASGTANLDISQPELGEAPLSARSGAGGEATVQNETLSYSKSGLTPASPGAEEPTPTATGTAINDISQPELGEAPLSARRGAGGEATVQSQTLSYSKSGLTPATPSGEEPTPTASGTANLDISQPELGEAPLSARRGAGGEATVQSQTLSYSKSGLTPATPSGEEPTPGASGAAIPDISQPEFVEASLSAGSEAAPPKTNHFKTADKTSWSYLKDFGRINRKEQTKAEEILWQHVRNNQLGEKVRRQHTISGYIADFAFMQNYLVVEIDGGYHNEADQKLYDAARSKHLNDNGYQVLRFTNGEVINDIASVLSKISVALNKGLTPASPGAEEPTPDPSGTAIHDISQPELGEAPLSARRGAGGEATVQNETLSYSKSGLTPASPGAEEPTPGASGAANLNISQPELGEAPLSARRGAGGEATVQNETLSYSKSGLTPGSRKIEEPRSADTLPFLTQALRKQLSTITVPFEGEPLQGIQVMGLLESRGLDFDHIIMLSANEGTLPRIQSPNSFLPDSIRRAFGLGVPEHQDAIFAYAFYRLLHRCRSITMMYNATINDQSTGEVSRFVPQLEFETNFKIEKTEIRFALKSNTASPITIEKTAEVMKQCNPYFLSEKPKSISPSAINSYINCQLQFYFRYLARLKEPDEIQDEVDAAVFGNIVHNLMELLYNSVKEKNGYWHILKEDIEWMKTQVPILLPQAFIDGWREKSKKPVVFTGRLLVVAEVVKQYANAYLDYDATHTPFTIEALETKFNEAFYITLNGKRRPVYFSGYIDRIDIVGGVHRMVDYKTGSDELEFTTIEKLFDRTEKKRNKAALQTLIYAWSFSKKFPEKTRFEPALLPLRLMQKDGFTGQFISKISRTEKVTVNADNINPMLHQLEDQLRTVLEELFDTNVPFTQTDDLEKCGYCPYVGICGRE